MRNLPERVHTETASIKLSEVILYLEAFIDSKGQKSKETWKMETHPLTNLGLKHQELLVTEHNARVHKELQSTIEQWLHMNTF